MFGILKSAISLTYDNQSLNQIIRGKIKSSEHFKKNAESIANTNPASFTQRTPRNPKQIQGDLRSLQKERMKEKKSLVRLKDSKLYFPFLNRNDEAH